MLHTVSLNKNYLFRRLYRSGKSKASESMAVYCRRNNLGVTRLGITVSSKLGGAVVRNRARRRLREAYRLQESFFRKGYDIVIVARGKTVSVPFGQLCGSMKGLFSALLMHV